jgi:catechol-2,3-dioxygenase
MNIEGAVINVADLDRSVDFYREVLGFTVLSQEDQLTAVSASGSERAQIVVLRAIGSSPRGGGRTVGLRALLLEVESADELERIASDLAAREHLLSRRNHTEWTAVVGRDPDGVGVAVTWHRAGGKNAEDSWRTLDDVLYGIGE